MKAVKLSKDQLQKIVDELEYKLQESRKKADEPHRYAHSTAYGYLEGSVMFIIKQLTGEYPII